MTGARADGPGGDRDAGFALVAALVAAVLFALFAFTILAADRGAVTGVGAEMQRARMEAAADAGVATVMSELGLPESARWRVDGRPRTVDTSDLDVTAAVEDERGKLPLNRLKSDQVRRLLQAAGVSGARLDKLADGLQNWNDGGARPNGGTALQYAAEGIQQRGAPAHTVEELAAVAGMDPELLARLAPSLTVFPDGSAAFEPQTAAPLTLAAVNSSAQNPAQASERPKLEPGADDAYAGRNLTIHVVVHAPDGGVFSRSAIVELTGQQGHPIWVRAIR